MKNDTTSFNSSWWDDFLSATKQMSQTCVFKNCLTKEDTALMRGYILEILSELASLRTNKYGYRVYIDGVQLSNNDMVKVYDTPPTSNDTVETWAQRAFGEKKFGLIINQGERFNLNLSNRMAHHLKPLLEKIGMPTEGIIFTLFIGNYDSTPLGIHLDLPGKSVIHFHLGPGSKTMYTWDTEKYLDLVGEQKYNNQEVEKYLPHANKFPFEEGDLYFMPEDTYHVGTQDGLSVAIACWCYNRSNQDFAGRLQSLLSEQYLRKTNENLKADKQSLKDISAVNKTLDLFELPAELQDLSFKDLLKEVYRDLRYSLHSNAGYRTSFFPKTGTTAINLDSRVEIEEPYNILYKESIDMQKLHVYVRGVKVEFNNFDCIKRLIDQLNKEKSLTVKDLMSTLDENWNRETGFYLISLLDKYHGIKIIHN